MKPEITVAALILLDMMVHMMQTMHDQGGTEEGKAVNDIMRDMTGKDPGDSDEVFLKLRERVGELKDKHLIYGTTLDEMIEFAKAKESGEQPESWLDTAVEYLAVYVVTSACLITIKDDGVEYEPTAAADYIFGSKEEMMSKVFAKAPPFYKNIALQFLNMFANDSRN